MTKPITEDHPLRQTWPHFLDALETDLGVAKREFAVFAYKLLKTRPPKILRDQTPEERDDWIQEIILHCTANECRVLREYRNTGRPFASWFVTVVNNKAYDFYRQTARYRESTRSMEGRPEEANSAGSMNTPDARAEFGEVLKKVNSCLRTMGRRCQILLQAAAEEYNPKEMLTLLGKDARSNKQVSDDLRACRKRLKALLAREGIDLNRLLT